ncbi:MAG: ComF family protein [Lachnospiraceae bacterium]|nr:ComF family protein [Lachnospiraceae bacterium]
MAGNLLFPPRCPVCDEPVRLRDGLICPACKKKLVYVGDQICFFCGRPLPAEEELCRSCRKERPLYERGRALYTYDSAAGSIYRYKYGGRREYARFFGREMVNKLGDFISRINPDGLIPVPLSSRRLRARGYNQAELLAKEIGRETGIPVYTGLVKRVTDTRPQKELNAKERQNNLKKAFIIAQNDVKLSTIIIIDDIYTTGSTVNAVTEVLLKVGVRKIYYVALSIGEGY